MKLSNIILPCIAMVLFGCNNNSPNFTITSTTTTPSSLKTTYPYWFIGTIDGVSYEKYDGRGSEIFEPTIGTSIGDDTCLTTSHDALFYNFLDQTEGVRISFENYFIGLCEDKLDHFDTRFHIGTYPFITNEDEKGIDINYFSGGNGYLSSNIDNSNSIFEITSLVLDEINNEYTHSLDAEGHLDCIVRDTANNIDIAIVGDFKISLFDNY